jgi:hypothetical protein
MAAPPPLLDDNGFLAFLLNLAQRVLEKFHPSFQTALSLAIAVLGVVPVQQLRNWKVLLVLLAICFLAVNTVRRLVPLSIFTT